MNMITINVNGKNYMSGKITAFLSKEALKIQRESLKLVKIGKEVSEDSSDLDKVDLMLSTAEDLAKRKSWLITEVYGNNFTVDELEKDLSSEEIEFAISRIVTGVTGIISKN